MIHWNTTICSDCRRRPSTSTGSTSEPAQFFKLPFTFNALASSCNSLLIPTSSGPPPLPLARHRAAGGHQATHKTRILHIPCAQDHAPTVALRHPLIPSMEFTSTAGHGTLFVRHFVTLEASEHPPSFGCAAIPTCRTWRHTGSPDPSSINE